MPCNHEIPYPALLGLVDVSRDHLEAQIVPVTSSAFCALAHGSHKGWDRPLHDALYRYVRLRDEGTDTKGPIHSCTNAALWNGSAATGMRANGQSLGAKRTLAELWEARWGTRKAA